MFFRFVTYSPTSAIARKWGFPFDSPDGLSRAGGESPAEKKAVALKKCRRYIWQTFANSICHI